MFSRFVIPAMLSALVSCAAFGAGAPYDAAKFATLLKEGKPILVHVSASWCPYCKKQDEVLNTLLKDPRFQSLNVVQVDFDTQKDFLTTWHVPIQSSLVAFKGGKEVSLTAFDTHADSIEAMMLRTL